MSTSSTTSSNSNTPTNANNNNNANNTNNSVNNNNNNGVGFGRVQFSRAEADVIRGILQDKLASDEVASRPGPSGTKLTYVESWKAIELANSIFGFEGWSCAIVDITPDYVEEAHGKWRVGVTAIVRITLKDGTSHEDVGYGLGENRDKGSAIDKAKKEAVSDARKRALRLFGNKLGNSVYDKEHLKEVGKTAKSSSNSSVSYEGLRKNSESPTQNGESPSNTQFVHPGHTGNPVDSPPSGYPTTPITGQKRHFDNMGNSNSNDPNAGRAAPIGRFGNVQKTPPLSTGSYNPNPNPNPLPIPQNQNGQRNNNFQNTNFPPPQNNVQRNTRVSPGNSNNTSPNSNINSNNKNNNSPNTIPNTNTNTSPSNNNNYSPNPNPNLNNTNNMNNNPSLFEGEDDIYDTVFFDELDQNSSFQQHTTSVMMSQQLNTQSTNPSPPGPSPPNNHNFYPPNHFNN